MNDHTNPEAKYRFGKYLSKAGKILNDRMQLERYLSEALRKVKSLDPKLKDLIENIEVFLEIIGTYISGKYRDIETKSILFLIGAILYFVNPFDLIPDVLPIVGFTDDAAVAIFVFSKMKGEIEKYKIWKFNKDNLIHESESEL